MKTKVNIFNKIPYLRPQFTALGIIVLLLTLPKIGVAEAPHRLGGIVLGGKIEDFRDKIRPKSVLPVRYAESLKEVEVRKIPGFKTGLVYYSTCDQPSIILRIEFKYDDSSEKFYKELLKRYKKRLGDPDQWRGDPFHIELGWKWKFVDANNNNISIILKHNTEDEEKKEGNSVKMTLWNLMNEEIRCFKDKEKQSSAHAHAADNSRSQNSGDIAWTLLVPR
jgi:hypothetical protein